MIPARLEKYRLPPGPRRKPQPTEDPMWFTPIQCMQRCRVCLGSGKRDGRLCSNCIGEGFRRARTRPATHRLSERTK